jgi:hypothetical protein
MRLMLGTEERPSLLVDVQQEFSPTHFEFWVVNGCWEGTFYNGYVTVWHPYEPWSNLDKTEILCDNQDRLRTTGWYSDVDRGYQAVFDNFHNPDYVAPKPKKVVLPASWDDDIPF